ncbi:hypothetical protein HZH68_001193 [Vespula germanica]|uniref:Uncharacterized protein n=1 Tax=Vespula germanica TaxID=30212 RepID=A0A834NV04_VESGE|nr:hypothetical protein HZH68_001193 [Vespula germanica]
MNHVKCIINANISRRVPSNTRITHCSSCKSEVSFKRRSLKIRSPRVDDTFKLIMRKIYQLLLERRREETRIGKKAIIYGQSGTRSKSIATSVRKFLSERKLPLQYIENVTQKQEVRFSSSSTMCYDHSINCEGDRDNRSYAQMITAYNETMMTIYNTPNMIPNRSKSKMNVRLSKTLFRTTSTLSYPTYNIENFTIKESSEETSTTDLTCAVDTNFNRSRSIDNNFYEKDKKTKDLETQTVSKTTERTYASIIADYSAAVNKDLTSDKDEDHLPNLSMISHSPIKVTTSETTDFISSPVLGTDSRKQISINEEIDWLRRVDKIIKDLKKSTGEKDKPIDKNVSSPKETNILKSVTINEAAKIDTMKFIEVTSEETSFPEKNINEESLKKYKEKQEIREIKTDKVNDIKMTSRSSSPTYKNPTTSNLTSTSKKTWSQIPKNTESNILHDPQVELRMVPSGNESVVSVNLEGITKVMESKNPNSKELSIVVSNNKKLLSKALPKNVKGEHQSNSCSMHISISEGSLPVKELELSLNGKPISDVRSIKARSETLNVLTSLDKVEIRVPYAKDNLNTLNQNTKNIVKNVENSESVLKLRIATAFDDNNPPITSGDTKKLLHKRSDLESDSSKMKLAHAEDNNVNVKMSELSSTSIKSKDESSIQKIPVKKVERPSETNVKKTYKSDKIQEKFERPTFAKIKKDSLERSNASTSVSSRDDVKKNEAAGDIDLRFSKTFNDKASMKSNLNVRKGGVPEPKIVSNSSAKSIENESSKHTNLKSVATEKSTVKSSGLTDKAAVKNPASEKAFGKSSEKAFEKASEKVSGKPSDKTSEKDKVVSLADIVAKHSRRSSDGNSSPVSNKPKPSSGKSDGQRSPRSNKHDSKTIDDITKKFVSNNQSSKTDLYDERMLSKSLPWRSDSYMKSKKEEDNQKSFSASTNVTDKQKANQSNRTYASNDKVQSKLTQDSLSKEKKSSTKWQNPSVEVKSSKVENKYDIKDSMTFSKPLDGEKTSKSSSTFKSGNVQITRDDPVLVNEKTTSYSSLNAVKIAEEKLNKRNDASLKREVKNVSTTKEVESMKKNVPDEKRLTTEKKDSVGIQMKESPKSDALMKNIDPGINPSQQNVDKVRNEKLIRHKVASFEEKLNMQTSDKKDSLNDVAKQTMNTNDLKDSKINNIFNSMKPIEKKKDGTLIDYGVKVASRKKPEKLTSRIKDVATNEVAKDKVKEMDSIRTTINEKATEKENQRLDNRDEIKSGQLTKPIAIPIQSPIKYSPRNVEVKKMDKVTNELKSSNSDDADKGKKLDLLKKEVNLKAIDSKNIKNDSLREKLTKTLEKLKENVPSTRESQKFKPVKYFDNDPIKELSPSTKEESTKMKNTRPRSDEGIVQNPSKSSSRSNTNTLTDSLTETILRCPSKELEKKKSKNLSYKHPSKNIQENSNITEKPKGSSNSINLLVDNTNKNKGDSSGSTNHSGTSLNPSNSNNSSSSKKTKPYSSMAIELIKFNKSHKYNYKETDEQNNVKDESASKLKRPEKELVYAVWLQRKKETTDDKMS